MLLHIASKTLEIVLLFQFILFHNIIISMTTQKMADCFFSLCTIDEDTVESS